MQNDKMDAKAERQEFAKRQTFERLVRQKQSVLAQASEKSFKELRSELKMEHSAMT